MSASWVISIEICRPIYDIGSFMLVCSNYDDLFLYESENGIAIEQMSLNKTIKVLKVRATTIWIAIIKTTF